MRLSETTLPVRYELHVHVDPRKERFSGSVAIELEAPIASRTLELHAVDLDITDAQAADAEGAVGVTRVRFAAKKETVTFQFDRPTASLAVTLKLEFTGPLRDDLRGLYLARSGKRRYAATQLEAADARRFFPCFDEPDKKARFQLTLTTPRINAAVSNGAIERTTVKGRNKTIRFRETPRLSTYLIALVVGELESSRARKCGDTPIRVWGVPGKRHLTGFALECAVESLARLERYFGLPYPYGKLDLIAVPDFEFGAMENAGAVTFRETLLFVDPKTITLSEKKRVAEVIAHELAHMWFGDLVTMAWWDDLWLNEAFATWMAFAIVDDWQPDWRMWLDFETHRSFAYNADALENTHPIYVDVGTPDEATENFDVITYEKGASVVRMVERWLGKSAFRKGVRAYIREHRESNARGADLWNALEAASGQPVARVVRAWIERPGFPAVEFTHRSERGRALLGARQDRFFASPRAARNARSERWPIPLVVRVRPTRGRDRIVRTLIDRETATLDLGPADGVRWAYGNADESGFYRALHEQALLAELGADIRRLQPAERMGLIGHQWAGLRADRAALSDFLALVSQLGRENEPDVLAAASAPLDWLDDHVIAELEGDEADAYRVWLGAVFRPALETAGWRPAKGETERDRQRRAVLVSLVGGLARDPEVREEIGRRADAYLARPRSLDSDLASTVIPLAARDGSKTRYNAYLRAMRSAATPQTRVRFQSALAAFSDPALIERTLALTLKPEVPTQDVVPLLGLLFRNPAAREATWGFVRERWAVLSPRVSSGLASRLVAATPSLKTPVYKRQVAAFFRAHPLPTAVRALRQAMERFDLDAELRRRARPALRRWLRSRR